MTEDEYIDYNSYKSCRCYKSKFIY